MDAAAESRADRDRRGSRRPRAGAVGAPTTRRDIGSGRGGRHAGL